MLTLAGVRSRSQVASVDSIGQDREYLLELQHPVHRGHAGQTDPGLPITFNRSFLNKPDAALRLLPRAGAAGQGDAGTGRQPGRVRQLSQVKF